MVLIDPSEIATAHPGGERDLYVALTRATKRLCTLTTRSRVDPRHRRAGEGNLMWAVIEPLSPTPLRLRPLAGRYDRNCPALRLGHAHCATAAAIARPYRSTRAPFALPD
ncbi:hypothetical protein ACWCXK_00845 [Streptomyces sp. NPDC001739]